MAAGFVKLKDLPPRLMHDALDIINIADFNLDQKSLGHLILEAVSKFVHAESSVLFLTDESRRVTTSIVKNLCRKKSLDFVNYFCRLDPLKLIHGAVGKKTVYRLEEVVDQRSFLASEYYNDFYKPQKIHHKLVVNLQAKGRLYGEICLHRSSVNRKFSKKEIKLLQTVTPYIVHTLEHSELRRKMRFKDNLLNIINDNSPAGIIILNQALNPIYANKQANLFCKELFGHPVIPQSGSMLPQALIDDCQKIQQGLKAKTDVAALPKHRIMKNRQAEKFNVTSRLIEEEFGHRQTNVFMIAIERINETGNFKINEFKESYQLTDREAEIAGHIFKARKNAEIAEKLFVSEITVKWHIRNLFEKVGVNTRTALIHKILFHEPPHPPAIESIMV
jgi:DNA-binding CsgD family transcriptional regulator